MGSFTNDFIDDPIFDGCEYYFLSDDIWDGFGDSFPDTRFERKFKDPFLDEEIRDLQKGMF